MADRGRDRGDANTAPDPEAQIDELRRRIAERGIALVLGAGVSADAGVPTWAPMLDALVLRAFEGRLGVDPGQARSLARAYSRALGGSPPLKARYLVDLIGREAFVRELRSILYACAPEGRVAPALSAIARLCEPGRGVREVVTYNFDRLLEEALERRPHIVVEPDTFPVGAELPIFHVHGWLGRQPHAREWLVATEDEFHGKYADPFDWANIVQLNAFSQRCCLFVGLSMEDPDLRRLLDAVSGHKRGRPQHFAFLKRTDAVALAANVFGDEIDPATLARVSEMRDLADASKRRVLAQLGVSTIWFEDFAALPSILERATP